MYRETSEDEPDVYNQKNNLDNLHMMGKKVGEKDINALSQQQLLYPGES